MSQVKHISCAEAVSRLYDFLDKEGAQDSLEEVEKHLDLCRHCCDRFSFEATLWNVVRKKGSENKCPESLRKKVAALLEQY